jgi:hypothetical protein
MPKSKTESSTPRLSEFAKAFVFPTTIERTVWPRVEAKGAELGLGFDWWQAQLGTVCLGYDSRGKYAATVGGIGLSIPRQVGKTYFVLAMIVILCILFPGLQVVWTAHHLRTSTKTFTTLRGICRRKKIAPLVRAMRAGNGEQQVEFMNGSMIMFGARSQGFGRGFDEIDIEVFDEAQILDTKALEDMIAATNQARNEHGALLFFMGTPPRPSDPSEAFEARRSKALGGKAPSAVWLEIAADQGSDPDDRSQWPIMNPSYPHRTPVESMERLRENLADDDSWNREGRGIWDDDGRSLAIPIGMWHDLAIEVVPDGWPVAAIGLDMNPERTRVSIAVSVFAPEHVHVELAEDSEFSEAGSKALVDWIFERAKKRIPVVIDAYSPARSLEPELKKRGCVVRVMGAAELSQACGGLYDAVTQDKTVSHFDQERLNKSLAGATKENFGPAGAWKWNRKSLDVDLSPLMAATAAHFGAVKFAKKPRAEGAEKRKVVIL